MKYNSYEEESLEESGYIPFLPRNEPLPGSQLGTVWQGVAEDSIPYSRKNADIIQNEVVLAFSSADPLTYICTPRAIALGGAEIKRFIVCVHAYCESYKPKLGFKWLLRSILVEDTAKVLKEMRTFLLSRSFSGQSLVDDGLDKYYKIWERPSIEDVGQIFNYKYWIRWTMTSGQDWKYADIPLSVDEGLVSRFTDAAREVLPSFAEFSKVQPDEILLSVSSSSCYTEEGLPSKVYKEKGSRKTNRFSKDSLRGYLTGVYKGPEEYRDAITLTVPQSNTIKLIEKQMSEVAAAIPTSAYGHSKDRFNEVVREFQESHEWFFNRDLTKEGWTKPRYLIKIIGKVMEEKDPDNPVWGYFSIYDKFDIWLDGAWYPTQRGHGLGMANALTTIMQCIIFHMVKMESTIYDSVSALFYNDDASIGGTESQVIDYADQEEPILEGLGLIRKEKKTYITRFSVLCEVYYPPSLNVKDSYWKYIRMIPFASCCLLDAKLSSYLTVDLALPAEPEPALLEKLISFFGYEYSPNEFNLPWWAGGWYKLSYRGVDLTFLDLEPSTLLNKGMVVGPVKPKPTYFKGRKSDQLWRSPIEQIYNTSGIPEFVSEALGIRQPLGKIESKFSRGWHRDSMERFFLGEILRRRRIWVSPQIPLSLTTVYETLIERFPYKDFIPTVDLRTEMSMERCSKEVYRAVPVWPTQPNKLLGTLCWFRQMEHIQYVIPWPTLPGMSVDGKEVSPERLELSRQGIFESLSPSGFWKSTNFKIEHRALYNKHWNNSYDVWDTWATLTGTFNYIRPTRRSRGALMWDDFKPALDFADIYGMADLWLLWTSFSRTLGILIVSGWDFFPDDDDGFLKEESPLREESPSQEQPVEEFTGSFADWKYSSGLGFRPFPYLVNLFNKVDALIKQSDIFVSLTSMNQERRSNFRPQGMPLKGSPEDRLIIQVTKVEAIELDEVYLYRPPKSGLDLWADDGDDGGGAMGGLFDE